MKENQKPKDKKQKKLKDSEKTKTILLVLVILASVIGSAIMLYFTEKESKEKEIAIQN